VLRYSQTGTEADYARMEAKIRTLVMMFDVTGVPGPPSSELLGIDPLRWNRELMYRAHHHALGTVADPYESVRRIVHAIDPTVPEERIRTAVESRPRRFRPALLNIRPDILSGLSDLRALGLRTGLISNAGYDEVEAWEDSPLAPLLDVALFSCHEHLMKPDPAFYLRAAERLQVAPACQLGAGRIKIVRAV